MIIKTLIADDSQIFRKKVIDVLKKYTDIQILGEAETGEEAVNKALTLKPDLIIMDVRMPDMDGIIATNTIKNKYPEIKIIMASIHDLAEYRAAAKKSGADAYVLKRSIFHHLYTEIKNVFNLA
ncbi:MAG: response regulator transcription factor [Candidatus Marinimicrobia bacterium]|nr:response regulator transcription factor [Candidatus Neomarinimicrobiota bacterium]